MRGCGVRAGEPVVSHQCYSLRKPKLSDFYHHPTFYTVHVEQNENKSKSIRQLLAMTGNAVSTYLPCEVQIWPFFISITQIKKRKIVKLSPRQCKLWGTTTQDKVPIHFISLKANFSHQFYL